MNAPLMTIITPVYNNKRFIESCILSVAEQNCPFVEHLIIDGASTDGTLEIIKSYTKKYSHIRCVSEKDNGQSFAMNKGIALAQGKIIGFLNADDYYEPNILARILVKLQKSPEPTLLVGNCRVLHEDGSIYYINKPSHLNLIDLLIGGVKNQFPHNPAAYFYHKSLHDNIGLYDESDHYAMDLDFILRAVCHANTLYIDEILGNYRYIEGTKTFESKENNQIRVNKMRVMNTYLKKLPLFQQWRIKTIRFLYIEQKPYQYLRKIKNHFLATG